MPSPDKHTSGPLAGIKVIDLSTILMGPAATQLLGDYGADVIKIEPPGGDLFRYSGAGRNAGMAPIFMNTNRNKRSIVLDAKTPEGRDIVLRICTTADVVIHNIRPAAVARMRLDYSSVKAVNERIVYVSLVGFRQDGPYAGKAAYDDLIQGAVGLPALSQAVDASAPRYSPALFADRITGMSAVSATLAALFHRQRTGIGQAIEVPMFETMVDLVMGDHMGGHTFVPATGPTGYARLLTEHRRPYRTKDGYVCVLLYNDRNWRSFFEISGELLRYEQDERLHRTSVRAANYHHAYEVVAGLIAEKTTGEWLRLFDENDIPSVRMNTVDDLFEDRHLQAIGFFERRPHPTEGEILATRPPARFSETPATVRSLAPTMGSHTREVMAEYGWKSDEIDRLSRAGIIG